VLFVHATLQPPFSRLWTPARSLVRVSSSVVVVMVAPQHLTFLREGLPLACTARARQLPVVAAVASVAAVAAGLLPRLAALGP